MTGLPGIEGATAPVSVTQNQDDNQTSAAGGRVLTPLWMALELLASPEAFAFTGRAPRALLSYERAILVDDVIRDGYGKAAVAGALRAAKTALGEGGPSGPDSPGGLNFADNLPPDERRAWDGLMLRLRLRGAMLPEEACALVLLWMQAEPEIAVRAAKDVLAGAAIACSEDASPVQRCLCEALPAGKRCAAASLDAEEAPVELPKGMLPVTSAKWASPHDEAAGLARIAKRILGDADVTEGCNLVVAVPNRAWAGMMVKALTARGLQAETFFGVDPVRGDPRIPGRFGLLQAHTLLALMVDEDDASAWRSWCAFGEAALNSAGWKQLEERAALAGTALAQALAALAAEEQAPTPELESVRRRYLDGRRQLQLFAGRRGFSLVKALSAFPGAADLAQLFTGIEGDEDAAALLAQLQRVSLEPAFADNPQAVRVGTVPALRGLAPRWLFVCGLVDGLFPDDADTLQALGTAAAATKEAVVYSTFSRAEESFAQRAGLAIRRTSGPAEARIAHVAPNGLYAAMGAALPSTVSGEQLLGIIG